VYFFVVLSLPLGLPPRDEKTDPCEIEGCICPSINMKEGGNETGSANEPKGEREEIQKSAFVEFFGSMCIGVCVSMYICAAIEI